MSATDDLKLLFDGAPSVEPPTGPGLEPDLDVVVVRPETLEDYFFRWSLAWEERRFRRPIHLPKLTTDRPVRYWVVLKSEGWFVIQYDALGEHALWNYPTFARAAKYVEALRAREKASLAWRRRWTHKKPPWSPKGLPKPPWRCFCGMVFDSAEAILAHKHEAEPQKESS